MFFGKSDLEERIGRLETSFKQLALEWELAYEKLLKLMGRIAKRAESSLPQTDDSRPVESAESASPDGETPRTSTGRFLTPYQRRIQQQILRRRAHIGG
jgi:hypothetical protein